MTTLADYLNDATSSALLSGGDAPFAAHFTEGNSRVAVVVGGNATGKSLYVRVLSSRASNKEVLPISISIRERTGAGTSDMAGMRRMMMFGDESEQSTGATSVETVRRGFSNLAEHAKERQALLILDEPEMGLSEDYAAAMGQWLAWQARDLATPNEMGVVVVTHSRALVRSLVSTLAVVLQSPHFVNMDGPEEICEWLDNPVHRTVDELLALPGVGRDKRKAVGAILNERKKKPSP